VSGEQGAAISSQFYRVARGRHVIGVQGAPYGIIKKVKKFGFAVATWAPKLGF
jgi:hypothetical protein